jgi:hypothetical protein
LENNKQVWMGFDVLEVPTVIHLSVAIGAALGSSSKKTENIWLSKQGPSDHIKEVVPNDQ